MSQPQSRQPHEFNDVHMLQQHIMVKKLQELQRQRQLLQLGETRQHNQLSFFNKQTSGVQLPPLVNGTPIHDASQMLMAGNMHLVSQGASPVIHGFPNGLVFSQAQNQVMRSMGMSPQQLNVSPYGTIASTGSHLNPFSHIQGMPHDTTNFLTNSGNNPLEMPIIQTSNWNNPLTSAVPARKQVSLEKNLFGPAPMHRLDGGLISGSFQQVNDMPNEASLQEPCLRHDDGSWHPSRAKLQNMEPSQGTSLDPLEEKLLFSTEDNSWESSFGGKCNTGITNFETTTGVTDGMNAFPSLQSGSWSALMQSAVAEASSNDTGVQEEWSGLSFQNPEISTENQPSNYVESGRKQSNWVDNNLQHASSPSSRHELQFQNYNVNSRIPGIQQASHQFSERKEGIHHDFSHESIQRTSSDGKWLDCSPRQKQPMKESPLAQMPSTLQNVWSGQHYEHSNDFNSLNTDWGQPSSNITGPFPNSNCGLEESKSGQSDAAAVNRERYQFSNLAPMPKASTFVNKEMVDQERSPHFHDNEIIKKVPLGSANYMWVQGKTDLTSVNSQQNPSQQGQLPETQRNPRASEEITRGNIVKSSPALFGVTSGFTSQSVSGHTSENLLHHLHEDGRNIDTMCSRDALHFPGEVAQSSDNSNSSQGFGLRLGPPSQWKSKSLASPESLMVENSGATFALNSSLGNNQLQTENLPHPRLACHSPQTIFKGKASTSPTFMTQNNSHQASVHGQEFPILETMPASQSSTTTDVYQQVGLPMQVDVPTTHRQFQPGLQNVSSNLVRSRYPIAASPESAMKASEDQSLSLENNLEEIEASSLKSQGFEGKEMQTGRDESHNSIPQQSNNQILTASASDFEAFGHSLRPSQGRHQSFSLLHQMQSRRIAEIAPNKRISLRHDEVDGDLNFQQVTANAQQQLVYGHKTGTRNTENIEKTATLQHNMFSARGQQNFNFSSEARENQPNKASYQALIGDNQHVVVFGQNTAPSPVSSSMTSNMVEQFHNSLPMAPAWFKQCEALNNGQVLPTFAANNPLQQLPFDNSFDNSQLSSSSILRANSYRGSQESNTWSATPTISVVGMQSSTSSAFPSDITNRNLAVLRPKKRKNVSYDQMPWHIEVAQGSQRPHNISAAKLEWIVATNQTIEKVEEESEVIGYVAPVFRSKRRLILTSQLMQQVIPPAPSVFLSAEASTNYDSVIYFASRVALGDACSVSSDSHAHLSINDGTSENVKDSRKDNYLKTVDHFSNHAKRLEADFERLVKRASILDLKVDFQELEKFSVINRLAKFHSRGHMGAVETSSSGENLAVPRAAPQRYVVAVPMPKTVPEGVHCHSL